MRKSRVGSLARAAVVTALTALSGCMSSVDSLGYDEEERASLRPLDRPDAYPNLFRDLLGRTEPEIDARIRRAFDQLFHGLPDSEAVYYEVGENQALIRDILHDDVRTEGVGLGMMITVQLGRRVEFDKLWRYARSAMRAPSPYDGYYTSSCGIESVPCIDPYGMQQFAMALVFAHGRWRSDAEIDYQSDALELLDVLRNGTSPGGGDAMEVFDAETKLAFHEPKLSASSFTRPSIQIPAYLALFAQATGDAFFADAARAARAYLGVVTHPMTGLVPLRTDLAGTPLPGWDTFRHEAYRFEHNLALDGIWATGPSAAAESDRLLRFFLTRGIDTYGNAFTLDGMELEATRDGALIAMNGAVAVLSTLPERTQFVQAVWDLTTTTGSVRYFPGMLELLALLVLSGRFQVY